MKPYIYFLLGGFALIIGFCLIFESQGSGVFVSKATEPIRTRSLGTETSSAEVSSAGAKTIDAIPGNSLPINASIAPAAQNSNVPDAVVTPYSSEIPATIKIEGSGYDIKPNSIGSYPRFTVPAKAIIPIHLQAASGEAIQEQVLDGGELDNESISRLQSADASGSIDFKFRVKSATGAYRLAIYKGGHREVFNFWVGPDLPQRVTENK